ncbi:MAG: hypothetical protein V4760_13380 [Bdellovibrionota bacterium]
MAKLVFHVPIFLVLSWSCSMARAEQIESSVAVSIGRSISWPVTSSDRVTVSNGAVVRVVDKGEFVKITGVKLGHAVIKTATRTLEVSVLPEPSYRSYERLSASLAGRRGLRVDVRSGALEVRGRLLRWSDWEEIADSMKSASDGAFRFAASIAPELRERVVERLRERVNRAGLPEPDFRFEPMAAAIVPLEPKELKERMEKVLASFGFKVEASASVVELAPMVRVKIVVAEIKKNHASHIGLSWPSMVTGQLLPKPELPSDGSLALTLQALESNGLGKVLASPTLLCRSGKEAEFLAGGEFPIKIAGRKNHEVLWKKYGVLLKIKPSADLSGRMSIALTTEVSMIDSSQSVDGLPGLLTNRIDTHFDLSSSRTIALSGLIKKEWGESIDGLPGLSKLPILGPLFGSRAYRDNESELVIFVTPELQRHEDVN